MTKLNKKLVLRRSVDNKTTDFARIVEEIKGTKTQVLCPRSMPSSWKP